MGGVNEWEGVNYLTGRRRAINFPRHSSCYWILLSSRRMETTNALLLRKTKLTDSSLIVTWFSAEHGLIKTVAKGARRPKSRFTGVLDLFFDCEIQIARSRRSELHTLREVVLKNPHEGLRTDYGRVAVASYFVELIELVTEPDHPVPELYDLLQRAFGYLNSRPAARWPLLHFESELARLLGIQHAELAANVAIGRVYHRLPAARSDLFKKLPER
jgi:DNA repair protein RecO (recombination protein O)